MAASLLAATNVSAGALHTAVGKAVKVNTYSTWDKSCTSMGPPQIAITRQPAHGQVQSRVEPMTVHQSYTGKTHCVGQGLDGIAVYYQPAPGFVGTDAFAYQSIRSGRPPLSFTYTVTVR